MYLYLCERQNKWTNDKIILYSISALVLKTNVQNNVENFYQGRCTDESMYSQNQSKKQTGISFTGPMLGVLRILDAILSKERLGLLAVHRLILTYHLKTWKVDLFNDV